MGVDISRLGNGLTIVTHTMTQIESVSLGIWVKSGCRNERFEEHGVAHMLEHMAFKGTENRTAYQIAAEIEDVGGEINAATSVETTAYYARVLKNDVPLAVDILADIITSPKFDEAELEREKQVVFQEIGAANDMPEDIVFDHFTETAFRHQTIGRPILGTVQSVRALTTDNLRNFMNEHYSADRMIVVAAGAVDHEEFVSEVEKRLGSYRARSSAPLADLANYVGGDFREYRKLKDAQVVLGFEGRAYHMRDYYASQILSIILGGGMSSRLFQEVREKRGLCYSIYAFHWGFSDIGLFGIHAASSEGGLHELIPVVLDELYAVSEQIGQYELDRAREQYRANLIMSRESPSSRAEMIARQMLLYGRPIPSSETVERLSLITVERLTDLARRLFIDAKPTLAAVGAIGPIMSYGNLVSALSSRAAT
ncbi:pitrilysin family protein [uncultured Bartonella sp.]|uniref:M16 family metallopeptidase n=1 Tax=uncultured Bartonella sp. TaxID=104108 RepID=UPI0026246542|nr:pitrilysin family protein [uncultured Bartonella sp.]